MFGQLSQANIGKYPQCFHLYKVLEHFARKETPHIILWMGFNC